MLNLLQPDAGRIVPAVHEPTHDFVPEELAEGSPDWLRDDLAKNSPDRIGGQNDGHCGLRPHRPSCRRTSPRL